MNEQDKKVPALRFKSFTNDWEQRKLGDVGKTQSGIGFPNKEQGGKKGVPFFKVSDMNNKGNEFEMISSNNYVTESQIDNKKWKPISNVPAVIFAKVGAALMLNRKRLVKVPFLIDNNTMAYIFNDEWDSYFGKVLFDTINLPKYAQTGALPSFNGSDIQNITVMLPSKDEQQRISQFFKVINKLIDLQQRKLDLLKQLKKGLLQKMFADKGSKRPILRFNGFTDDWEQRKLGDVVKITMGQSPNGSSYHDKPIGEILVQGNADLQNGYVKPRIWTTQITKEANKGDIIMSVRAPAGEVGKTNYHVVIGRGVAAIKGNEFIYQLLSKMNANSYWKKYSTGSTFESLNSNTISNAEIILPSLKEQQKIGIHFKRLDHLITLHQRKQNHLKLLKKSLLQQMFM